MIHFVYDNELKSHYLFTFCVVTNLIQFYEQLYLYWLPVWGVDYGGLKRLDGLGPNGETNHGLFNFWMLIRGGFPGKFGFFNVNPSVFLKKEFSVKNDCKQI